MSRSDSVPESANESSPKEHDNEKVYCPSGN